jgi:ABC-type multidrug transport system ATPase subunit
MAESTGKAVVEVVDVGKKYGGRWVLRHVKLLVNPRDRVVIMGPNGSGKSTLVKILMGLTSPSEGFVKILGERVGKAGFDKLRRSIGYMPEKTTLPGEMRVEDYLSLFAELRRCTYDDLAESLGLKAFYKAKISTLSQGYQRRVMLAAALLGKPRLVILDEPYANLDIGSRFAIDELLQSYSKDLTLIMTTHVKPGLSGFRTVLLMNGNVIGSVLYEDDYVEISLTCGNKREVLRVYAKDKGHSEKVMVFNKLIREGCIIEGIDVVTFESILREMLSHQAKPASF